MSGKTPAAYPARFARRLFAWFALATAVPVLVLSGIVFVQINGHLEQDAYRQLHRVAKVIGMYLYARLDELDGRLEQLTPDQAGSGSIPGVQKIVLLDDEAANGLSSQDATKPGAVLFIRPAAGGGDEALLIPAAWRAGRGRLHAALLAPDYLQAPAELLPPNMVFCLLGVGTQRLICSEQLPAGLLEEVGVARLGQSTGGIAWNTADAAGQASYWSIFLRGRFITQDWAVLVSLDDQHIKAPLATLQTMLPRVLLLAFLLAMLLAFVQLRLRLRPLGRMVDATRQFANGDYTARVNTNNGDELTLLADAFNNMATHTELQFKRLDGLAELDRLILSSFEEERIIDLALERIRELVNCEQVVFLAPSRADDSVDMVLNNRDAMPSHGRTSMQVPNGCTDWLSNIAGPVSITATELHGWPMINATGSPTLFPVCREGRCFGAILVDWVNQQQAEFLNVLHEFSDRLAVALSNAAWEGELFHQAHYDALTGLANRTLLTDRLEQALLRADRTNSRFALMFVDLDGFKAINDTLGHKAGDEFLVIAGERLRDVTRTTDSVVRFGGDEFVVLASDLNSKGDLAADLATQAKRMIEVLALPADLEGRQVSLSASIGIAVYPNDGNDAGELLRNADTAMYHAKAHGRGHAEFYAERMNRDALDMLALRNDLAETLRNNRGLLLEYQPQLCAETGRVMGVEALVRWQHPTRGLISPGVFVPLAEETGQIVQLGEWVLREACSTFRSLRDQGMDIPRLAVNVAPSQFWADGFLDTVITALKDADLPVDMLELEVTEGAVMRDLESGKRLLAELRAAGIQLSVDDFGTGYSSLSYLQHLPLHTLKIDRAFVTGLGQEGASDAIVAAIITLGKRLGLRLIAEGIEHAAQAETLRQLQCDELQGFLFSRPLPAAALIDWYRAQPVPLAHSGVSPPSRDTAKS